MYDRRIFLGEWSNVGPEQGHATLTPNANAARTLGVELLSIETLARQILGDERIAAPLTIQRLLRGAVEEALGSSDPDGVARTMLPPVRELYRADADLDADQGSPRARRVMEVARTYRSLLRAEGLIDPAEMLWHAARALPKRRPVLVWGYPRLGRDEVALIDGVAGEGSVLRLPYAEDHTFNENKETAEELERRGWTIDKRPPQASWDVEIPVEAHIYPHLEAEVRGL
jgi:hypothetical protein